MISNEEPSKIEQRIAELGLIFKFLDIEQHHPATGLLEEADRRLKHFLRPQPPVRKLKKDGWIEVRVVGSHHQFRHADKQGLVTVPHPKKDLPLGTVKNIFKQAGLR